MLDSVRAKEVAHRLFAASSPYRYGPIEIIDEPDERIPGLLYSVLGEHPDEGAVSIQLFGRVGALGGQLWEREADALIRASRRDHPALPVVLHGGYDDSDDVGFVVTKSKGGPLGLDFAPFREDPSWALRCLALLLDALCHIHACGIVHRNLTPDALLWMRMPLRPDDEYVAVGRFEFSSLLASMLKVRSSGDVLGLRGLLAAQAPPLLACVAPERLGEIFPAVPWRRFEDSRMDVFSLGMIAWQWFVAPLPEDLLAAAFPGRTIDVGSREGLHAKVDQSLGEGSRLPRELRRILRGLLAWDVGNRLTAAEARAELSRDYEAIHTALTPAPEADAAGPAKAWIISGTAHEFADLKTWGWIPNDPSVDFDGLKTFLERDLNGGVLVYDSRGFEPYDPGFNRTATLRSKMQRAKWVLLGSLGAYFCSLWESDRAGRRVPWALQIRYTLRREYESARELEECIFQRRLPNVRFVGHDSAFLLDRPANRALPSWQPLLESVQAEPRRPVEYEAWRDATGFLLQAHAAELEVRQYPFRRVAGSPPAGDVTLEYDWRRDEERAESHSSPLIRLMLRDSRRSSFTQFFDTLQDRKVAWYESDERGRIVRTRGGTGYVLDTGVASTIRVRLAGGAPMPASGWLGPDGDRGTRDLLLRQRTARTRLLKNPTLLSQLHHPRAAVTLRREWADDAAADLDPASHASTIVPHMLRVQPFFALQGPPGTGKSLVTSIVVASILRADPSSRILVSAQSHAALDELAGKIVERFHRTGKEVLAIRIASDEADVRGPLQQYLLKRQTAARLRIIENESDRLRSDPDLPPGLRELVGQWHADAPRAALEVEDRLRRGANLVFATCGTATPERLGVTSDYDLFDYVFVEEAAKAWPTEVVMPLVLGLRWTLVGDHKQLSAHKRADISRLLTTCETAPDLTLQEHGARKQQYTEVFDFFGEFFKQGETSDAVDTLDTQFRMREPIAEVISSVFYDGSLRTSKRTDIDHELRQPAFLSGRSLIWLDTHGLPGFEERRVWKNQGEAGLIARLLRPPLIDDILAFDVKPNEAPLAILSPYRQQNSLLESALPAPLGRFIHTVHSFQGGQARVVICSLVRTNAYGRDDVARGLGHVADEEVVNVMLSRAQRLQIIVGDFNHFASSKTRCWPAICAAVQKVGTVLPATVVTEAVP